MSGDCSVLRNEINNKKTNGSDTTVGFLVDLGPNWYESRFEKQTVNSNIKPNWFDQRKHKCVKTRKHMIVIVYLNSCIIGCLEILPELLELDPPVMNLTNDLLADQQLRIPEHPNKLRTSFGLIVGVDYEGERERDSLGLTSVTLNLVCQLLYIITNTYINFLWVHVFSSPPRVFVGERASIDSWHHRLAHPHESILRRLISAYNLPMSTNKLLPICNACQLGKSHRLHLPPCHVTSKWPFDLIYSDVWGPAPISSLNGNNYFLLFIDDCTKFIWVYFLRSKSQVLSAFTLFKTMVETQFSTKIKAFQSDWGGGGGEYRNVSSFLQSHGIVHRVSCPYTPEQNGASERRNRVIVEKGLALLAHSKLPVKFWEEAFHTAVYTNNRTITPFSNTNHLMSIYIIVNLITIFSNLLVAYVTLILDLITVINWNFGYSAKHKGYICFHVPSSRTYIARHVVFDESSFPFPEHNSKENSEQLINSEIPLHALQEASTIEIPTVRLPNAPSSVSTASSIEPGESTTQLSNSSSDPSGLTPNSPSNLAPEHNSSISLNESDSGLTPPNSPMVESPPPPIVPATNSYPNAPSYFRPAANSEHGMVTRASTSSLKPKSFTATKYPLSHESLEKEPKTFLQATKNPHWKHAMQLEFDALMFNRTWELVPRPPATNVVGNKWIFRIKRKSDGTIERYKARLVAKGFNQEEGVDYFDTIRPVIKPTTIRLVLSIAVTNNWPLRQVDVNNAFLNGDLSETVYMDQPQGFVASDRSTYVCKLKKALYGLKQAPRAWFQTLQKSLIQHGFKPCISDTSLFIKRHGSDVVYVLIYVDDLIITGSNSSFIDELVKYLNSVFSLKDLGDLNYFLGIEVHRSSSSLLLSQRRYILDLLERSKMTGAKPIASPAEPGSRLYLGGDPMNNPALYRSIVGALQYVTITRPEIAYSVNRVCQFMHNPSEHHWTAVKRILRYLKGTLDLGLIFRPSSDSKLVCFTDAGWISDPDDCRSQ
ncbi:hypothetical protein OSB04_016555 [Centaurea solstitialis]|uniref:Integrase catalytic domain-containing protein n=1 Tax=Centaurea solstitialis TaxID=347529 RepID=A0AA38T166_9ASTR|nr:hypothetical protein OSB04_016555 [Centaurea solstitialis]